MRCLFAMPPLPGLILLLWAPVLSLAAAGQVREDTEDSPLFTRSMQRAYEAMETKDDSQAWGRQRSPTAGLVVPLAVVNGPDCYAFQFGPLPAAPAGSSGRLRFDPRRLSLTTDFTCMPGPTCNSPTCGGQTCGATCGPPGPTICLLTCSGGATCQPNPTCYMATCPGTPSPTCATPSCSGATCAESTCSTTCSATNCATPLFDVTAPQSGQIAVSFNSSARLRYILQYCTNLTQGVWEGALCVTGNNTAITLTHTNACERSYYRLLIQDL